MAYKKFFKPAFLALLIISAASCNQEPPPKLATISGPAFGTTYNIKYYTTELLDLSAGIDSVLMAVNQSMSTYWEDSDISRINGGDSSVVTDIMFREVFKLSQKIHQESAGYFDPTIGVLRNAYGFGDTKPLALIDSLTLDSLMVYVGFNKVRLNDDGTVFKENPQIYFDFNAVAKGYGIDRLGAFLDSKGLTNYIVELGGEILARGSNLNRKGPWLTGIEAIDSAREDRTYQAIVNISDIALAASGNYRKFRIDSATGKRFVHTLNPLTGSAETSDVTSATVLAMSCAEADAYATTFMALGFERSKQLLGKLDGVEAYLTYTAADSTGVFITEGFKQLLKE